MGRRLSTPERRGRHAGIPGRRPSHPRRRSTDLIYEVPRGCPSFLGYPGFRAVASLRVYGRDSTIVRQGDAAHHVYVLRRGLVQMSSVMPNGKSFVDLMGPGGIFGVHWVLARLPHRFGLTSVTESECDQVEGPRFLNFLEEHPNAALELLRYLTRQEIKIMEKMLHLAARVPSGERLMSALVELGRTYGLPAESGLRIPVPLTVQMLADKIGCSRQWASKTLGELEAAGKIKRNRSWITLTDRIDENV
jgi:CRP/FNR family cyclic AMP-dependent transcriptional regulator